MTDISDTDSSPAVPSFYNWITGLSALLLVAGLGACQSNGDEQTHDTPPPVVDVTAVDYAFQAPDSIPSGWVTFRMANKGEETHYFALQELPDGKSIADWRRARTAADRTLDSLKQLIAAGTIDTGAAKEAYARIAPDWLSPRDYPFHGGVGFAGPGCTAQTTLHVTPGRYILACYAKTSDGTRHAGLGMRRGIVVTDDASGADPPEADVTMTSAEATQVTIDGTFQSGPQTVAFQPKKPANGEGHPHNFAHLAPVGPETDLEAVAEWDERAPAPVEFVGGMSNVPTGRTAYATVDLQPGRYAWVFYEEETVVRTFRVE